MELSHGSKAGGIIDSVVIISLLVGFGIQDKTYRSSKHYCF